MADRFAPRTPVARVDDLHLDQKAWFSRELEEWLATKSPKDRFADFVHQALLKYNKMYPNRRILEEPATQYCRIVYRKRCKQRQKTGMEVAFA